MKRSKDQSLRCKPKPDGRKCKHCGSTKTTKAGRDACRCQDCWNLTIFKE